MLIELGRQIPKQPHSKSMHGRFHGQDANAVREKQSMKPTGHQAILVHNPNCFPPAMLGMIALQQSGIGISRELIIAVDGQRTRDVTDFGEAIEKAEAAKSCT
jgi:hypothetical protein